MGREKPKRRLEIGKALQKNDFLSLPLEAKPTQAEVDRYILAQEKGCLFPEVSWDSKQDSFHAGKSADF